MGFRGQFARQQPRAAHVRFGSTTDMTRSNRDVRSTLESRHSSALSRCPFRANSGLMQRSKNDRYSITSSARADRVGGTSMPSAFAVLRLITNSNLVDCTIGRSAGLAPLRIWPA
jgi:hypothetical protein